MIVNVLNNGIELVAENDTDAASIQHITSVLKGRGCIEVEVSTEDGKNPSALTLTKGHKIC